MTDAELAFKTGALFNQKITSVFWDSFKGEYGRVQVEVLTYLFDHGEAQASEIAEELNISKQHVSKIVREFLSAGYLSAVSDPEDKRASRLSLSAAGRAYLETHFLVSGRYFEGLLGEMEESERETFCRAMETITQLLTKYPAAKQKQPAGQGRPDRR